MTLDELWEKWSHNKVILKGDFLAALKEYGESVRQQAVRVCNKFDSRQWDEPRFNMADEIADAIEKMEIK